MAGFFSRFSLSFDLKELLKASSVALLFKFLGVIIGYLFFWVLAKLFGAEGVGLFSTLWTFLMVSVVISKLGFDTSIVKFIASFMAGKNAFLIKKMYRKGLLWIIGFGGVIAIIAVFFAKELSILFFETPNDYRFFILTALCIVPLSLLNYNAESLKGLKKITLFSIFQNGSIYLLTLLIILIFYYSNYQVSNTIVYALLISILFIMFFSFMAVNRNIPKVSSSRSLKYKNRHILSITLPMLLSNSLFLIMNWTDTLMLSGFRGEDEVGIYSTSLKIAALNSIVLVAINSIAMPKFAELYIRKDKQAFENFVKQSTLLMFSVSFPILLVIFLFPKFLLGVFGDEFTIGITALLILAFGQFFSAISGSTIHILNMTGKQKLARNILLLSTSINIVLNFYLIPIYGINGAAIATAFSTILWNVLAVIYIYKYFKFLTYPFPIKFRVK